MIKVFIYSCLLLVFLINCKSNIPEARNKTDYSQITHYSSRSAHPISSVNFDTIRIDAGNENEMTSLLGSFLFLGDTLCFADREQSTYSSTIGTGVFWVPIYPPEEVRRKYWGSMRLPHSHTVVMQL